MRILVFLLALFFFSKGQQNDSLFGSILSLENDTERVNRLYKLSLEFSSISPVQSLRCARVCEQHAKQCGSQKHLALAKELLGNIYLKQGEYGKALPSLKKAMELYQNIHNLTGIAKCAFDFGNGNKKLKMYARAEEMYLKSFQLYEALGDEKKAGEVLVSLGDLKYRMGAFTSAIECYNLALPKLRIGNDYELLSQCFHNSALVYQSKGEYKTAIGYHLDALKFRTLMENPFKIAESYTELGETYLKMNDSEQAKTFFDKGMKLAKFEHNLELQTQLSFCYANYYSANEDYEEAYRWMKHTKVLQDSLLKQQELDRIDFNLNESIVLSLNTQKTLHNQWLLIILFASLILIPLFLIQFKR